MTKNLRYYILALCITMFGSLWAENIEFADPKVKAICVAYWDTNGDGELSMEEAAKVESLGNAFAFNTEITSFDEFQYFTGITNIYSELHIDIIWFEETHCYAENAFSGCTKLESIIIPNSVKRISTEYFEYEDIPYEVFPYLYLSAELSTIESYAGPFARCKSLKHIEIPNSVEILGDYAFSGCTNLESVTLPNAIREIGRQTFMGCTALTSINIPNSVTTIGIDAFKGCTMLSSITLPNSLTSIGDGAFYGCSSLSSIFIPNTVSAIGSFAFYGCSKLESINLPSSITSLENGTFANCTSLRNITLPSSIKSLGTCFDWSSTISTEVDDGGQIIPLEQCLFEEMKGVFQGCYNLEYISLPSNIESLGDRVFQGCKKLQAIILPNTIQTIGAFAFKNCTSLKNIDLPNTLNYIRQGTFADCTGLSNITIPNSVTRMESVCYIGGTVGDGWGGTGLDSEFVGRLIENIGDGSFEFNYLSIEGPFEGCSNLTNVQLSDNLDKISQGCFARCTNLQYINIPNSVSAIEDYAFADCEKLKSIELPNSITSIYQGSFFSSGIESIIIPNSVTKFDDYAEISKEAYGELQYLNGWYSLDVSGGAFDDCPKLTNVTVNINNPITIQEETFSNRANATLYVPYGSKVAYASADYWKEFKQIKEIENIIDFADPKVKALCVANWDANGDRELSCEEAALVASLGTVFQNSQISSFDELQYFTGLTSIGKNAFSKSTLQSVIIPETVTTLDENAFLNCSSLTSINLPAKVKSLKQSALSGCTSMTTITVDEANETFCSVNGVLFSKDKTQLVQFPIAKATTYSVPEGTAIICRDAFFKSKLSSVVLPSSLKELKYDAFGACKSLTELTIPEGVTTIGEYLLDGCTGLKTLRIPSSVETIGQRMCNGCKAITDVYSGIISPFDINSNCFNSTVYANATLHVPYGTEDAYATASGWKEFGNKTEMDNPNPLYAVLSADKKTLTFYNDSEKDNKTGTVYTISGSSEQPGWYGQRTTITNVVFDPSFASAKPKTLYRWFYGMENLKELEGMEFLNTTKTTDMKEAFYGCGKLKLVDVSGFDMASVTDLSSMFSGCNMLASLDLSHIKLSDGAKTNSMLLNCSALKTLKLAESLSGMAADACSGVGTSSYPCILFAPAGFDFGVSSSGTFEWKSGYFRLGDEPVVYANNTVFFSGQTLGVSISLKNGNEQYNSYQFDLTLPEGFSFKTNAHDDITYTLGNRYSTSPSISTTKLDERTCRVTAYLNPNEYITGTDGVLISLNVKAEETATGTWVATLSNIFVGLTNNVSIKGEDTSFNLTISDDYLPGDVNHDGFINMSDGTMVISYILGKSPVSFFYEEADVNADGWINMSDVTSIIAIILGKKPSGVPANSLLTTSDNLYAHKTNDGFDLYLDNMYHPYSACEMTLTLPEGCALRSVQINGERKTDHLLLKRDLGNGVYRLVVYSPNNASLCRDNTALMRLKADGLQDGDINISDIVFINEQNSCILFPDIQGAATGISEVNTNTDNAPAYHQSGIRIQKGDRGLHISKGRKVVVR